MIGPDLSVPLGVSTFHFPTLKCAQAGAPLVPEHSHNMRGVVGANAEQYLAPAFTETIHREDGSEERKPATSCLSDRRSMQVT